MSDCITAVNIEKPITFVQALQGPRGADGAAGGTTLTRIADTNLSGHRVVKAVAGGKVGYPSISAPADATIIEGITTGAALANADVQIQVSGEMVEPTWNWSLGPIFCDDNGVLTQTLPSGTWLRQIAVAVSTDTIIINFQPTILTP